MTETTSTGLMVYWNVDRAGLLGLPQPGMPAKLVPAGDRYELRVKGPNVMPGYWRNPEATAEAFDEEGFFRTGDAARWVDESRPEAGIDFAGRLSEEFKLASGTWVRATTLRTAADRRAAALCARPGDRRARPAVARRAGLARSDGLRERGDWRRRRSRACCAPSTRGRADRARASAACCRSTSRRRRPTARSPTSARSTRGACWNGAPPTWRGSMPNRSIRRWFPPRVHGSRNGQRPSRSGRNNDEVDHSLSALAGAAVLAAFAGPALAQKKGGTLTVGLELDIPGFDPLKVGVYDTSANIAASLLLEHARQARRQRQGQGPASPLSWSNSDDFKIWTFKLRPDVKFHDGTPFNAAAVKWNFDRQKDPKNNCRCAFYIANILSVEAKDDLTVVYTLKDPAVNFPALLTRPDQNSTIHSPTAIQAKGDDYNRNPVGTGPFVLKSWTAGDRMVVERNPNYWNKGMPHLDRVVLRPLPDSQSRFASLKSGETDLVWADEFEADNIVRAQKDPTLQVLELCRLGRGGERHQHQGGAARRRARAPGAGHGARPQEDVAGAHQRARPAGQQSLRRRLVGQVQGRRRAAGGSRRRPRR